MLKLITALGLLSAQIQGKESAAILVLVEGTVTVTPAGGKPAPARAFDWIEIGSAVETAASSRCILATVGGQRYELGERTRSSVNRGKVEAVTGEMRQTAASAPIPRIAAIEASYTSVQRGGAVRLRGPQLANCDPSPHSAVLPDRVIFSFEPAAAVRRYSVEVRASDGTLVHKAESAGGEVKVPEGLLAAGSEYVWRVTGMGREGGTAPPRCEARFRVLSRDAAEERAAFVQSLNRADPSSLLLLAEVDRRLGLVREARIELREASASSQLTPDARAGAERLEERLREK